jgi:hypothetical protein
MTGTWSQNQKQILRSQSSQSRTSSLNQNGSFLTISVITIIVISILFLIRPINASSTNHASTANNAHHISSSKQKQQQQQQVWPLNKYAREALSKAEAKFQNMDKDDIIVDPNSNRDTENQKSIYIATEFLNHASPSSITGLGSEGLGVDDSYGDDRMVKVGRSLVDLVRLADAGGNDDDNNDNDGSDSGTSEKVLSLGLQHIVEQCDILAKGDLKVSYLVSCKQCKTANRKLSIIVLTIYDIDTCIYLLALTLHPTPYTLSCRYQQHDSVKQKSICQLLH